MKSSPLRMLGELHTSTHEQRLLALRVTIKMSNVEKYVINIIIFSILHPHQVLLEMIQGALQETTFTFLKISLIFKRG